MYTEQLLELHRGQGMEIYWRDSFICPSEEEYNQMTMKSNYFKSNSPPFTLLKPHQVTLPMKEQ